jgi:hypothetical protein
LFEGLREEISIWCITRVECNGIMGGGRKGRGDRRGEKCGFEVTSGHSGRKRTVVSPLFTGVNEEISIWCITRVECNGTKGGKRKESRER